MTTGQAISKGERPPFTCPECAGELALTNGTEIYPHRSERVQLNYWICRPCRAWIIASSQSGLPLGTPANAFLRHFRAEVSERLASLAARKVERDGVSRKQAMIAANHWLAREIKLDAGMIWVCDIGLIWNFLDEPECRAALSVLKPYDKGAGHGRR